MKRISGAVLASLSLAACTGTPAAAPPVATAAAAPPAATISAGPSAAPRIAAITDCGTFDLPLGDRPPASATTCFVDAVLAGRPARLKVTGRTTEGRLHPVTYTGGADGRVEVIIDSRKDAYGGMVMTRHTCTGPRAGASGPAFDKCSEPTPIQSATQ